MRSRILVLVGVAAACLAAAGIGAWLAVRSTAVPPQPAVVAEAPPAQEQGAAPAQGPAAGTEAELSEGSPAAPVTPVVQGAPEAREAPRPLASRAESPAEKAGTTPRRPAAMVAPARQRPVVSTASAERVQPRPREPAVVPAPVEPPRVGPTTAPPPLFLPVPTDAPSASAPVEAPPPKPEFRELIVPTDSVIGLRLETTVRSATARIEDKVEAAVTRSVRVDGLVAIPADSRAEGSVILVERGGKFKERARIGVRFHTVVLADGTRVPVQTEAVFREGESQAGSSAAKVGGAAVGGAILGAIFGGGKGAAIGGSIGAAGGTTAVMAGPGSEAVLPAGTAVTVRVTAPVTVTVER